MRAATSDDAVVMRRCIEDILLRRVRIKRKYVMTLFSDDATVQRFCAAFTHNSVDAHTNYEWLEILGDATVNKAITFYITHRFPFLCTPEGVKVIARLKINLVSGKQLAAMTDRLGLSDFIRVAVPMHDGQVQSLREDVFEAFIGALEVSIDSLVEPGAGYGVCYRLVASLLDEQDLSLRYEDLYDAVTRVKETFDFFKQDLWGNVKYQVAKRLRPTDPLCLRAYQCCNHSNRRVTLGEIHGEHPEEMKQRLASTILAQLHARGFRKPISDYYTRVAEMAAAQK